MKFIQILTLIVILSACKKASERNQQLPDGFTKYTIRAGQQYSDQTTLMQIDLSALKFEVKFDSTAVYNTSESHEHGDINKLYGFSDNALQHHEYSARFGWRWNNNALRLFAYTYNATVRDSKELCTVAIGQVHSCSIKVKGNKYIFIVNQLVDSMPRLSTTATAIGYKLFPYFGGDLTAPHNINIWIKEL